MGLRFKRFISKIPPLVYENNVSAICCGYKPKSVVFDALCSALVSKGTFGIFRVSFCYDAKKGIKMLFLQQIIQNVCD